MVTDQLLTFIRQNRANGLARPDIEKALLAAGWQAADIATGFTALEHPVVPAPVMSAPVLSPDTNAAEVARIEQELKADADRRGVSVGDTSEKGGLIGWLIRKKVVEKESQANVALLGVAIITIVLTVGIFIWGNSTTLTPGPTQEEINAMHIPLVVSK